LPAGTAPGDASAAALLRPLRAAGFHVDALLSPAEALALLAASRPQRTGAQPAVWAAVNVNGVAIAVVRGSELLFSRAVPWSYNPWVTGSRAQLLQRYSLVAQLAAEIRHAVGSVRLPPGEKIGTVTTCGDLPDLRSLTMPLIEELDLEVETLDSTEGMQAVGSARLQHFAESAPAIRLACAAALYMPSSDQAAWPSWTRVAAGLAILAALGWGAVALRDNRVRAGARQGATATGRAAPATSIPPNPPASGAGSTPAVSGTEVRKDPRATPSAAPVVATPPAPIATTTRSMATPPQAAREVQPSPISTVGRLPAPSGRTPEPAGPADEARRRVSTAAPAHPAPAGGSKPTPLTGPVGAAHAPSRGPTSSPPAPAASAALGRARTGSPSGGATGAARAQMSTAEGPRPSQSAAAPVKRMAVPPAVSPTHASAASPPAAVEGRVRAVAAAPPPRVSQRAVPEPLPRLDSILIDQDRRLAIVEGAVVRVGDPVGSRVVVQIERDGVVLREISGLLLRIGLRAKSS
jgi:hypothetical protein